MELTVLEDGITGKCEDGKIYNITGITLYKDSNNGSKGETFYDKSSKFYQVCCPTLTKHRAKIIKGDTVTLL